MARLYPTPKSRRGNRSSSNPENDHKSPQNAQIFVIFTKKHKIHGSNVQKLPHFGTLSPTHAQIHTNAGRLLNLCQNLNANVGLKTRFGPPKRVLCTALGLRARVRVMLGLGFRGLGLGVR